MEDQCFIRNVEKAKLAEHCDRFHEMAGFMKDFIVETGTLTEEHRNLFSVAYKNLVGAKRTSWRTLNSAKAKCSTKEKLEVLEKFKAKVEEELHETCNEVIKLLDDHLIPNIKAKPIDEDTAKSLVFYLKMKGDYYRYICEAKDAREDDDKKAVQKLSEDAYTKAVDVAGEQLKPTSPIRLGLALNFSVFMYEIVNDPEKACTFAKQAFDDAIADLDNLPEKEYKDSTLIMQLLRDNLTLWTNEETPAADEQVQQDD